MSSNTSDQEKIQSTLVQFAKYYQEMAIFLNSLNINPKLKEFCFLNFDQGAMWAKEAIMTMPPENTEIKGSQ